MRLKAAYKHRNPEGHYFDAETMQFFDSVLEDEWHDADTDTFIFLTSERKPEGMGVFDILVRAHAPVEREARCYTVRFMNATGHMSTLGPFNELDAATAGVLADKLRTDGWGVVDGELVTHPFFAFEAPAVTHAAWTGDDWATYFEGART